MERPLPHIFCSHSLRDTILHPNLVLYGEVSSKGELAAGTGESRSQRIVASVEPESEPKKGLNEPLTVILN